MEGEDSFDSLAANHSADGKDFVDSAALTSDYNTGKDLYPLLLALSYSAFHVNGIANLEIGYIFFKTLAFNSI